MVELPESNLAKECKSQVNQIENTLSIINELIQLCSDSSLPEDKLLAKAIPLVKKLGGKNPHVAEELKEVLMSGDHEKIKAFSNRYKRQK